MSLEAEAVPNPDAQRAETASVPSTSASAEGANREQGTGDREQGGTASPESQAPNSVSSPSPESQIPNPSSSANPETQTPDPGSCASPESQAPSPVSPPNPAQKPKRKYTMSQRAIDSRRANIKLAHAVPKEIVYRSTPRRKESCRAKLVKAREAKRRKREEGKSTGISHGLTCADLRASLAAAAQPSIGAARTSERTSRAARR